jgi:hypothetical protein
MPLLVFEITEKAADQPDAKLFNYMHVFRSSGFNIHFGVISETMIPVITNAPTMHPSTGFPCLFGCPWKLDMAHIHASFILSEQRFLSLFESPPRPNEFNYQTLLEGESVAHQKRCAACFEKDPVQRNNLFEKAYAIYEGVVLAFNHSSLRRVIEITREDMQRQQLVQPHSKIATFTDDSRRTIGHCLGGMAICALFGKLSHLKFVTLASAAVHWVPSNALELACMLRMLPSIAASETSWSRFSTPENASPTMYQFAFACNKAAIGLAEDVLCPLMLLVGRRDLFTAELGFIHPDRQAKAQRFAESTSKYLIEQLALPAPFTAAAVKVVDGNLVERKCAACDVGIPVGRKNSKCSGCGLVYYCCKDCQVAHWKQHKSVCKR